MPRVGIIGHPVAHSLSPVFQSAAFAAAGIDTTYELWDTPPEALAEAVEDLRHSGCFGANVTIPHKEAVVPLLDELDAQAARVGAVNTIVNREGRLAGFNTDGSGLVRALRDEAHFDISGRACLLLGAGGAARGIVFALGDAGAARVDILNRTPERALRLAADASAAGITTDVISEGDSLERYDCVVNCTSIGMHGGPEPGGSPVDVARLGGHSLVVDIVYAPAETPLLKTARERALQTFPGLPMLIYQGALAFELWTGITAPVQTMFEAARNELQARGAAP